MNLTEKIHTRYIKKQVLRFGGNTKGKFILNTDVTWLWWTCSLLSLCPTSHPVLVMAQEHFEHKTPNPGTLPDLRSNTVKAFPAQFSGVQNQASLCHASPGPSLSKAARPYPSQALSRNRCYISQGRDRAARTLTVTHTGPPISAAPQLCLGPSITYHFPGLWPDVNISLRY